MSAIILLRFSLQLVLVIYFASRGVRSLLIIKFVIASKSMHSIIINSHNCCNNVNDVNKRRRPVQSAAGPPPIDRFLLPSSGTRNLYHESIDGDSNAAQALALSPQPVNFIRTLALHTLSIPQTPLPITILFYQLIGIVRACFEFC